MPAHMKKPHTKQNIARVAWHGANYEIPVGIIKKYKVDDSDSDVVSVDEVFGDIIAKYGESAVLLKGLRHREGLSQTEFAKIIGVTQTNLSAMENKRRAIGKEVAKRIAEKFGVDYRLFL